MKKSTKKLIILLIITICIAAASILKVVANDYLSWDDYYQKNVNGDRNKVVGYGGHEGNVRTLGDGVKIEVVQYQGKGYSGDYKRLAILAQPNVYCAEKGAKFNTDPDQNYVLVKASQEYEVTDQVLAYILNHGPTMNLLEDDYESEASQQALWWYLKNSTSTDKGNIGVGITDGTSFGWENMTDAAKTLYDNAVNYGANSGGKPNIESVEVSGNNLIVKVSGYFEKFDILIDDEVKEAGLTKSKTATSDPIEIDISNCTNSEINVKVKAYDVKYKAKYRVLASEKYDKQKLLVVTEVGAEPDTDEEPKEIKTDISLQKYIVAVNGKAVDGRKNKYADNEFWKTYNHIGYEISNHNNEKLDNTQQKYKLNDTIMIEMGDEVTYRIHVYNNSSVNAKKVSLKDKMPYYGEDTSYVSIVKITRDGSSTDIKGQWKQDKDGNGNWKDNGNNQNTYNYIIENLAGGTSTYFDVTLKYDQKYTDAGPLINTAWISDDGTVPSNKKGYRIVDRDYVQMEKYSVSLEKFITKVTDAYGNNVEEYENRHGKRYNDQAVNEVKTSDNIDLITRSPYKSANIVEVEPGDIVTYTIRLKNTHDENKVKITQFGDTAEYKGNGVHLDVMSNGNATKSLKVYNKNGIELTDHAATLDTSGNYKFAEWGGGDLRRYLITFSNAYVLEPGEYIDVKIEFKVVVPYELTNQPQELYNRAGIFEIRNAAGYCVSDSSEDDAIIAPDNNADLDYIKTKTYAVSLEKYVLSVNGKNVSVDRDGDDTDSSKDKSEHKYDDKGIAQRNWKYNNPVKTSNGDEVVYKIKVKNDGQTKVTIENILDYMPDGVNSNAGGVYCTGFGDGNGQTNNETNISTNVALDPGDSSTYEISGTVTEKNISNNILKNVAKIGEIKNRNGVYILDTTTNNNKDADYIYLDYEATTTHTVKKVWDDNNNPNRPESITVKLYDDLGNHEEVDLGKESAVLSEANNWTYTWKDLPIGYNYIARELNENGEIVRDDVKYNDETTTAYNITKTGGTSTQTTITNKYNPPPPPTDEKTEYTVKKVWIGDYSEPVDVTLYGNEIARGSVVLSADNNWEYTWTNLAKYDADGKVIEYTARELSKDERAMVQGQYKYDENVDTTYTPIENGMVITNIKDDDDEKVNYTVVKDWVGVDADDQDPIRVRLFKVEGDTEVNLDKDAILNSENNWTYTWTDLDRGVQYIARELSRSGGVIGDNANYDVYTNTEYTTTQSGIKITNKRIPNTTSFTVEKVWDDDNNPERPAEIMVRLFKNGEKCGDDVRLSKDNWTHTWTNLEKIDSNGKEIIYTAKEIKQDTILWVIETRVVLEDGDQFNDEYKVSYLNSYDKTTITNTKERDPDEGDLAISGIVWNDLALDKTNNLYDGLKSEEESVLSGIKVNLYRIDVSESMVATTYTDANGRYTFTNDSLSKNLSENERFIKGPKVAGTDRWVGTYYSYVVMFEYDGIIYTSTEFAEYTSSNEFDSNAKEDNTNIGFSRSTFNTKVETLIEDGGLTYSTINEEGYVPQSIHNYDASKAGMHSTTSKIELSNNENVEKLLKHINLGLRGRDTFDLELTTDVHSTKVTVNGVSGQYNYNDNKVTVRRTDISGNYYDYSEDAANQYKDGMDYIGESYVQGIRDTDISKDVDAERRQNNYASTGLAIEVTYKVTVKNTSKTPGAITKIINYYDDALELPNTNIAFYYEDGSKRWIDGEEIETSAGGTGYDIVTIHTPVTMLNQNQTMDIYIVYKVKEPSSLLDPLLNGKAVVPIFNMSEIAGYRTGCDTTTQTEYTRGLIDKDSAPGSAATEKVRLDPNLIGEVTTVEYYFGNYDLMKLKYEDDTYAAPTLCFALPPEEMTMRTITGTVFEDKTVVNPTTRIKTGNGKLDAGEVGVYGAKVELYEQVAGGPKVRYETETDRNGKFEFTKFLPGNYYIVYTYGHNHKTYLLHQGGENINKQSYNGEDYQSTNNEYAIDGMDTNVLNSTDDFWYVYNETDGISTARDRMADRIAVSNRVVNFTDEEMTTLNNMRDLVGSYSDANGGTLTASKKYNLDKTELKDIPETVVQGVKNVAEKTYMTAQTPNMLFTVEKTIIEDGELKQRDEVGSYLIENMNFGIAEVPVTTIDLQKGVQAFTITDATGENILAKAAKDGAGRWLLEESKNVVVVDGMQSIPIEIEDQKLQGARLQVTYNVSTNIQTEKNYDNTEVVVPTIKGIVDFIDNDLSYNENLGDNGKYWEVTTYEGVMADLETMKYKEDGSVPRGTVDPEGKIYTTIVKAREDNPILLTSAGTGTATITLEKILSSDSTFEEIVTSTVQAFLYNNIVEITQLSYTNESGDPSPDPNPGGDPDKYSYRDRVRTPERYIILPGVQYDYAASEEITIRPPTGDTSVHTMYYVMALIGLVVLAAGTFAIKKYVIKK